MARLQLQLEGLSQAGWRPPAPAAAGLVSPTDVLVVVVVVAVYYIVAAMVYTLLVLIV